MVACPRADHRGRGRRPRPTLRPFAEAPAAVRRGDRTLYVVEAISFNQEIARGIVAFRAKRLAAPRAPKESLADETRGEAEGAGLGFRSTPSPPKVPM